MTARGIKKPGSKTMTTTLRGRFESDTALQNKLLMMYKREDSYRYTELIMVNWFIRDCYNAAWNIIFDYIWRMRLCRI